MKAAEAKDRVSGVILAGGKSSRMGRPKALLPFDGEPLIVHLVRTLNTFFDNTVVVAAPEQELPSLPVTLVRDEIAYRGPVGGIYYGLRAAKGDVVFLTSCDVPFLNLALISYLISQIADCDVVVPYWQGRFQPLHAVYRKSVAPLLREQLERGELRPIFLYEKVRTRQVSEDEIRRFDPAGLSFLNMNTPEDYEAALKHWQHFAEERRGAAAGLDHPGSPTPLPPCASSCTVELFSIARLLAKTSKIDLALPRDATLADVLAALSDRLPVLVGPVIAVDRKNLAGGIACNINGRTFVRDSKAPVHAGDSLFIISADAGG